MPTADSAASSVITRCTRRSLKDRPPRKAGSRSSASTVAVASIVALAVDIMAANAAAMTSPRMPSGNCDCTMAAKALLAFSKPGSSTWAVMPIKAPTRP
ncbi:hypothetical protein D3C77_714250 [compost metagenome]